MPYNYYGGGTHTWPCWARDLRAYVGPLMRRFERPPAPRRGIVSVRTPPWYDGGAHVRVRMRGHGFTPTSNLIVGSGGQLRLTVPLGDASTPRTTRVSIRMLAQR